jgi:hypothetical protein
MSGVDPTSFEFAVSKIDDGFIFERFIQEYLSQVLGYDFVPAGGIKDRGIDELDHIFYAQKYERNIYQMSILSYVLGIGTFNLTPSKPVGKDR